MHCFVYASLRKADCYLWLLRRDGFDVLPASLALTLGELRFVLEVQLSAERQLPNEDTRVVLDHLQTQGWHLQVPPKQMIEVASETPLDENVLKHFEP